MGIVKNMAKDVIKEIGNKSREFYEFVLPPVDMLLEKNNLQVTIDMPGFQKDQINLRIHRNILSIYAEKNQNNKPNEILKMMSVLLSKLRNTEKIDSFQMVALDQSIKHLCDHMGKAERINNTVFPTQYRSYTHTGLIIFTFMLPYGMLFSTGPFVILICILVSFFFFMIENIAFFLQDPFMNRDSDIPMNALCRTIEINLLELIESENVPAALHPDKRGVLM